MTRAGIGLLAAENSPNLAARFGGCGEMGVLALYEQTPSRLPVVQDCNYRAEGAGPVVNRQRHGGPSGASSIVAMVEEEDGQKAVGFGWREGRRKDEDAACRQLLESCPSFGISWVKIRRCSCIHLWMTGSGRTATAGGTLGLLLLILINARSRREPTEKGDFGPGGIFKVMTVGLGWVGGN